MPVISIPGNSYYEAGCHYASSYNTQASLITGCAAWCFPLWSCLILLKWYFMGSKQRKVRAEWGGQEMVFHRYGLSFSLSYFRDDESIIYKFLQVGEGMEDLQENGSLLSMYLHCLETDLFHLFLFWGGMLLDLNTSSKLLKSCNMNITVPFLSSYTLWCLSLWNLLWYFNIKEKFCFSLQNTFIMKNYECLGFRIWLLL